MIKYAKVKIQDLSKYPNLDDYSFTIFYHSQSIVLLNFQFNSVQWLSCVQLFATPWTAARQSSLSITNSRNSLKLMSIESVFQQHKRRLYKWTSPDGQHRNQTDYTLCSQRWRSSIQSAKKKRQGADCGSDQALLIAKFRLKQKKQGKPLDHSGMT